MNKNIVQVIMIALVIVYVLSGCSPEKNVNVPDAIDTSDKSK